jgi:hypothetical protein
MTLFKSSFTARIKVAKSPHIIATGLVIFLMKRPALPQSAAKTQPN